VVLNRKLIALGAKNIDSTLHALEVGSRASQITWPLILTVLNSMFCARSGNRGITRKVLADERGVTAFHFSENGSKKGISDFVERLSLKTSGGTIGNRSPRTISAHRNGRP
jgi:hypothetical protein